MLDGNIVWHMYYFQESFPYIFWVRDNVRMSVCGGGDKREN